MKIIVPATSANIGPGFDSVGVAVSKYLTVEVLGKRDEWLITCLSPSTISQGSYTPPFCRTKPQTVLDET